MIIISQMETMDQKVLPRCVHALVALTKLNVNYAENISTIMGWPSFWFFKASIWTSYAWKVDVLSQIPTTETTRL
jgi:hypothetical protein